MWHLGIDIGGTFTDFALSNAEGALWTHKCLTSSDDPSRAVLEGARQLLDRVNGSLKGQPCRIHHGTTLITNAIVERRGAKTALITTRGFRDVLEIRREGRYDLYDLGITFSDPLAPRSRRHEVDERMLTSGRVQRPLRRENVVSVLENMKAAGVESVAVVFLHAYANAAHEETVRDLAATILPGVPVSLSSAVCPLIREYERTSTTVANAYVRPITESYLARLVVGIKDLVSERGAGGVSVSLMQSDGGVLSPEEASQVPIRLVESGPAGGVLAAACLREPLHETALLSFDMGGTTAKMAFLTAEGPRTTSHLEVDRRHFYQRGSGIPLLTPAIDLVEIGAGGGSYASLGPLGTVQVGPASAGAHPGPCAYGQGGARATVTDADVVLGFLNPEYFLGGDMQLDPKAAHDALAKDVAHPLDCSVMEAAEMVYQTVTANMADATRVHAAERGVDLTSNALIAFGGAGPVHAWGLARHLRIPRIIFPGHAGVESALGFLAASESYEAGRTIPESLDTVTSEHIQATIAALTEEARRHMTAGAEQAAVHAVVSMRYRGQGAEIQVALPRGKDGTELRAAFLDRYRSLYGHVVENIPIEIVTWRVRVESQPANLPFLEALARPTPPDARQPQPVTTRLAWNPDTGSAEPMAVFRTRDLEPGMRFRGPGIIEDPYATLVLGNGSATVMPGGTVVATVDSEDSHRA